MGLGKTLQTIAFLDTVFNAKPSLGLGTAIVLGPKNTLYNWQNEFRKWETDVKVHLLDAAVQKSVSERAALVKKWAAASSASGSVLLVSYEMCVLRGATSWNAHGVC